MDNAVALADTTKPGIDLAHAHFPVIFDSGGEPAYLAAAQVTPSLLCAHPGPLQRSAGERSAVAGRSQ